jgi:methylase of polypeptide subunit release factors
MGAVFTRRLAADLVLDLAGYSPDRDLAAGVALEPSCGSGAFLVPMIERLVRSCRARSVPIGTTAAAIRAYDLDPSAVRLARAAARTALLAQGESADTGRLAKAWVTSGDFLLGPGTAGAADRVVGNPPYVRLEDVEPDRSDAYRAAWKTMQGRADVYVGFIEAGLAALRPRGVLSFICADRWMRNQYGARLRRLVEDGYAVGTLLTLHDADAFEHRVSAYPAIVVVRNGPQGPALFADADASFGPAGASSLAAAHAPRPAAPRRRPSGPGYTAAWTPGWFAGGGSWPAGPDDRLAVVTELESRLPALGGPGQPRAQPRRVLDARRRREQRPGPRPGSPARRSPRTATSSGGATSSRASPACTATGSADASAVRQVVQVVAARGVSVGAQVLARRALHDLDLGPAAGPRHVVGVEALLDVVDRVGLGPGRPVRAVVAQARDSPWLFLPVLRTARLAMLALLRRAPCPAPCSRTAPGRSRSSSRPGARTGP